MKKRIVKITAMLLLICTVACMLPNMAVQASAESASFMSIEELQARFPEGKYWNHYVSKETESVDYLWDHGVEFYAVTNGQECTNQPCASHSLATRVGQYNCNYFNGGMQCCGFARRLGYLAFGTNVTTWPNKQNTRDYSSIKPGDVIHYYGAGADVEWGHWAMVIDISDSTVTKAECNTDGTCIIRWGLTVDLNKASRVDVYSAPATLSSNVKHLEIAEGYYALQNKATKSFLSVAGGADASKTNIDLEEKNASIQVLYLSRVNDSFTCKMTPKCCSSGVIVNAWGDNPASGANVNLYKDVAESSQWWQFDEIPEKGVVVRLKSNPSLVLSADGNNVVVTTYTGAAEQYWKLVTATPNTANLKTAAAVGLATAHLAKALIAKK